MKIVFASMNSKKAIEIQRMAPTGIEIICLKDIPEMTNISQVEENGSTFLENATIKAKYWATKLNMPVLAEDSGITIDALNGYPGVYTKRCIQDLCPDLDINSDNPGELYPVLLKLIQNSTSKEYTAHWFSALVYINCNQKIEVIEELIGNLCPCAGEREFGFDQYFKPQNYNKTLSELTPEEKDLISPRKKAFLSILNQLDN